MYTETKWFFYCIAVKSPIWTFIDMMGCELFSRHEELSIFRQNFRGLCMRTAGIPLFYGHSSVFPSFCRARLESFSRHPWVHSWTPQEHSLSFLVPNPLNYPDRSKHSRSPTFRAPLPSLSAVFHSSSFPLGEEIFGLRKGERVLAHLARSLEGRKRWINFELQRPLGTFFWG